MGSKWGLGAVAGTLAAAGMALAAPARQAPKPRPAPAAAAAQAEFFETKIRPVLFESCVKCHGPAQQLAGLRVDSREGLLKGGARGPSLVPGKPASSLLVQVVAYTHASVRMPPTKQLPPAARAALSEWVRQGAHWPDYGKAEIPSASLWSLKPVRRPALPRVKQASWVRNPVDAFVLARLEAKGMVPAPPAGKPELMRRLYLDLTGLPPTPEETAAYLADPAPDAYEKLVDRLLASPRYGERWARHWLDLVRYADSNGYERDAEKPYSWKYRDYVIRALNADKPFNRFLTEQLAGDELPDRSEETFTATGFLRLGTWDDEPNDPLDYRYERLDDLVNATATAFLGLTVKCARCHDHKFDPLPQKDYYAFAAAFYGGYLEGGVLGGPPPAAVPYPVLAFTDKGREAPPLHLLEKGDARREGPVVEPGFLSAVTCVPTQPVQPPPAEARTTHRRLQLARWLTDPAHPLTARVWVNRVWQHHFGEALVRTPNNFGRKGDPPTHPELLDWLAATFVAEDEGGRPNLRPAGVPVTKPPSMETRKYGSKEVKNASLPAPRSHFHTSTLPHPNASPAHLTHTALNWSTKSLHRLILLSNTYRMASVHPQGLAYAQRDFDNRLLWRQNRRRLDADALRDSMLAVSGSLSLKEGGPGFVPTVQREALEGLSKKGAEWVPSAPEEQQRRTVYMFLKRSLIMPLLTAFDFPDTTQPVEQRDSTLVAPQALALLNNPFVHEQADNLARRLSAEGGDPARQVRRAWQLALGRAPSAAEERAALAHLRGFASTAKAPMQAADPEAAVPREGLSAWLRADRGVTADAEGRVSAWKDSAGSHEATADGNARPLLVPNVLNGRPVLRFDGQGRFLTLSGQPLTTQQYTLVAVVNDRAGGSGHREIFSNWRSDGNIGTSVFFGLTGHSIRLTDHFSPAGAVSQPERHFILSGVSSAQGAVLYQDRREAARRQAPLPERKLDTRYVIGQQGNINGEFWNGDLAELLVYNRALAEEELARLWDSLAARYGIAARPAPADPALASLCRVLLNSNEFVYVD